MVDNSIHINKVNNYLSPQLCLGGYRHFSKTWYVDRTTKKSNRFVVIYEGGILVIC
jgi:hypothetical protein